MANLIDHWSYSSLMLFMRNRLAFKKVYIMKQYDGLKSPSSVVGNAGHKALEAHYNGLDEAAAIEVGMKSIQNTSDTEIDYGKTGSREKMLKDYTQAINSYFAEMPEYHEIIGVEKSITTTIKNRSGKDIPMPAKAKIDLVTRNAKGEIEIVDHKFVGRGYTDAMLDNPSHLIQAMFCYHTIEAEYGEAPRRIIFNECKIALNRDGSPQIQPYTIEFNDPALFTLFYNLYNDCTKEITKPDVTFLPNFDDMFDGQNAFEIYRQNIIGVDAPVAVNHKLKQVDFVEKKYVASNSDKVENKNLTPEEKIRMKLAEFGVPVEMAETHKGAAITQYTLKPGRGRKMSEFEKYAKDIAYVLEAQSIRVDAPIRGTSLVGIEVPSTERTTINLDDKHLEKGTMSLPIGVDVYGKTIRKNLADMPHLLVAGATGAGKSVFLNVVLTALTKQMDPSQMKLILIDPKRVELSQFRNVPHLMAKVIYEDHAAERALNWLVDEMEQRYEVLEKANVRSVDDYAGDMPKIVCVIDEFADLMLAGGNSKKGQKNAKDETLSSSERAIIRLAQKSRAVGIHLILATQRPSVDVVTGLIKANIPTKVAFMTSNKVDSRVILDVSGAEELTGKGDMLFLDPSKNGLTRLQGFYA